MILSACGSSGDNNSGDSSNSDNAKNSGNAASTNNQAAGDSNAASDLKPYKLKLVYEGPPQPDEAKVEEAMNKILTAKINATIDLSPIDWGAWDDKVNLMIASASRSTSYSPHNGTVIQRTWLKALISTSATY